ncbi:MULTISPECIES: hypothetical protein [Flavobacteriaceae]|jgi:hypothetical protein|uniref:Transcriptional regulator n=1 Tax=Autumnicola patrickiae TaxID=3075591 RepID=A0ABU3E6Z1_9FLAO|nr:MULTISPECIES: hypothetical protein [Flavobacteriaceae]MAN25972.1 hypothetical protein [Mesonia sp.]MDT0691766.1 hypothetical protein [Salegentibacter sp. F188]
MNYIKLLNAAFEKFFFDDRLNPTHISLYMALFQEWNSSRFASEFYVNRRELMRVAKIGSKSTYHRCVTDLDSWKYLFYYPSNNPYKGSKIKMAIIGTSDEPDLGLYDPELEQLAERYHPIREPVVYQHHPTNGQAVYPHRPVSGQALVSNINNTKQVNINKQPNGRQAVLDFFIEKSFSADEGKKFLEHYQANDWKTSDGKEIRDWRAVAINWMDRTELFTEENKPYKTGASQIKDNLRTTKTKDYGQPL